MPPERKHTEARHDHEVDPAQEQAQSNESEAQNSTNEPEQHAATTGADPSTKSPTLGKHYEALASLDLSQMEDLNMRNRLAQLIRYLAAKGPFYNEIHHCIAEIILMSWELSKCEREMAQIRHEFDNNLEELGLHCEISGRLTAFSSCLTRSGFFSSDDVNAILFHDSGFWLDEANTLVESTSALLEKEDGVYMRLVEQEERLTKADEHFAELLRRQRGIDEQSGTGTKTET